MAGTADLNCVSTDPGPNGSGLLADPVSTRTGKRVGLDIYATHSSLNLGPCQTEKLVDTAAARSRD